MFIGRKNEVEEIKSTLKNPGKHVLIYGNRRVGKTTLAVESAKKIDALFISFECLKTSIKNNIDELTKLLNDNNLLSFNISFNTIIDLFKYLNSLNKHIILLIDEYPYLYVKNDKDMIDSYFQNVLDNYSSNLNIILSGSHIGMMKTIIKESNPLFGRFDTVIHLKEFDYYEASLFYDNLSNYDKVAFYSVFGGSPFILGQLDYSESLEYNIKKTFLNLNSAIYLFVSENYTNDLATKDMASSIFSIISNGNVKYSRLEELLGYEHNGLLNKQLNTLIEMEFLGKNEPINKIGDNKKVTYYIKNNALRFYFLYVYAKKNTITLLGSNEYYNKYISNNIITFISKRFEEISRCFLSLIIKKGYIKDIVNLGTYYYDDSKTKTNGEFDIAVETHSGFDIIEVKYLKGKVSKEIINKEISQIKEIKGIKINNYGFISINGFEDDIPNLEYKYEGDDLYSKNFKI